MSGSRRMSSLTKSLMSDSREGFLLTASPPRSYVGYVPPWPPGSRRRRGPCRVACGTRASYVYVSWARLRAPRARCHAWHGHDHLRPRKLAQSGRRLLARHVALVLAIPERLESLCPRLDEPRVAVRVDSRLPRKQSFNDHLT